MSWGDFHGEFCCVRGDCSAVGVPNLPPASPKFRSDAVNKVVATGGGTRSLRFAVNDTEVDQFM